MGVRKCASVFTLQRDDQNEGKIPLKIEADKEQEHENGDAVNNASKTLASGVTTIKTRANNSTSNQTIVQCQPTARYQTPHRTPSKQYENNTGLPNNLKTGIENLSGYSMGDVRVHYNSSKPARLNAHAYAQGTGIHLASGQEKHLPHEAWHVVQQKQGRVQKTKQLKGIQLNDDTALEKEADIMGNKALAAHSPPSNNHALRQSSRHTNAIQRVVRYGYPYRFINGPDEIPDELAPLSKLLAPLIAERKLYAFDNIAELRLLGRYPEIIGMLRRSSFESSHESESLSERIRWWMQFELNDLIGAIGDDGPQKAILNIMSQLGGTSSPEAIFPLVLKAEALITKIHLAMFTLGPERQTTVRDGSGDLERQIYGYHLTKLHNISGIAASGLSPREGAGARGSLAMSTEEQRVGSTKTSRGVVAFGLQPSTFRPYINQFEDRRQMIEGSPLELKPIMLRFKLSASVRKSALDLLKRGIVDFMDARASNTEKPVLPDDIEVLTAGGWVRIRAFSPDVYRLHEMRSGDDNSRMGGTGWTDNTAIFTYQQLKDTHMDVLAVAKERWTGEEDRTDVQLLESMRDQVIGSRAGITYTFRGATMQTSGHAATWQYAVSVTGAVDSSDVQRWLGPRIRLYQKEFAGLARSQIETYRKDASAATGAKPERTIDQEALNRGLTIGAAPGDGLNCLLNTICQLRDNQQGSTEDTVAAAQEMRGILTGAGLVGTEGMIDIYGGAGMQLANDLNLRIQLIEQRGPSNYVVHPILGRSGPIIYILHTPGHFQPLWPK